MGQAKVYELKIDDSDDISGIDSISLVDEPAIEVNWVAFNKVEEDFHIPDGEDESYVKKLLEKAENEDDLLSAGYVVSEMFATTTPNAPSFEDNEKYLIRYKYALNPEIKNNAPIIPTTRRFCKDLLAKNYVWRAEDMEAITNEFGQPAMVWRGGFNCRHKWIQIKYKRNTDITNKASITKGQVNPSSQDTTVIGYQQPSTGTDKTRNNPSASTKRNLGLSKQEQFDFPAPTGPENKPKVSLDYDGVLSTPEGVELAKTLIADGKDVYIITKRNELEGADIEELAKDLKISRDKIFYTDGQPKWKTIKDLKITEHYDNNPDEIKEIEQNDPGVKAIQFDYDVSGLPPYVEQSPAEKRKKKKEGFFDEFINEENFKSYTDYPSSVKETAKRVLDHAEKNGWGACGTAVGKARANQLASGKSLTIDTIHRIYSYLSRHKGDLSSSKSYDEGCGKLMYDAWGGEVMLHWAERKIQQISKTNMSKQQFATDEEKRIVLGPAMIPNEMIFRKDEMGSPYFVFFSSETIKMICEKYMKNKYVDNNDMMHNGKALKDVYVFESWIKESENDKSSDYGFENLPIGTWFVSMKINNDKVWNDVKLGKLKGFSVSGMFEQVAKFNKEEMFLTKVAEILSQIEE